MFNNLLPTWLVAFILFCCVATPIVAIIWAIKGIIWVCQHVRFT